ncbi:hypothetical protein SCP_1501840 [Sparassis crispa]|uniref:Uncharacterized protein n=1 Tax=Sparassis crispa TaxID=139825 RepID=A0A401H403_9APHY|nr:hypothetical protein SCP_1501840 [Sparassis crispa]GBE89176.1 hypothetical protein SCP_1501840 [Sparassis crispa]
MVPTMIDPAVAYLSEEGYDATAPDVWLKAAKGSDFSGVVWPGSPALVEPFSSHGRQLAIASDWLNPAAQQYATPSVSPYSSSRTIETYPIRKRADMSSYNALNPYTINNATGAAVSNGTSYIGEVIWTDPS